MRLYWFFSCIAIIGKKIVAVGRLASLSIWSTKQSSICISSSACLRSLVFCFIGIISKQIVRFLISSSGSGILIPSSQVRGGLALPSKAHEVVLGAPLRAGVGDLVGKNTWFALA